MPIILQNIIMCAGFLFIIAVVAKMMQILKLISDNNMSDHICICGHRGGIMNEKITDKEILIEVNKAMQFETLKNKNILIAYHAIRSARSCVPFNEFHLNIAEQALMEIIPMKENKLDCTDKWHTLSYDEYCKQSGGKYPRSCPACHNFFKSTRINGGPQITDEK